MDTMQPHIKCGTRDAAAYAVLPGDPQRVDRAKEYLTDVREIAFNREYKSIIGRYKNVPIMVVSTGIGGPSMGIAVEELHNIGVKTMIRIGSCGALQSDIHLGELIIANGAVRDDGISKMYAEEAYPAVPDTELLHLILKVLRREHASFHTGLVRSHDSFYTDRETQINRYWSSKGILGADMETAALFTIGSLRGVRTASILNTVTEYNGDLQDEINQYTNGADLMMTGEKREILTAFEVCAGLERKGMEGDSDEKI